ncbi:MAG TPA: MarC family protein, partial [bacterium]|nr:MarC family protein [bacterium]
MEFAGFKFLLSTMISLFVIVDPLGSSSVFATLTKDMTAQQQKRIAWKAVTMSILLLITFGFVGQAILSYMHISLNAFKVAGGMLLFV